MKFLAASLAAAFAMTVLVLAQIPDSERSIIDDYVRAVGAAQSGAGSIETAFLKAASVSRSLARIDDNETLIDSLTEDDIRPLRALPGIAVPGDLGSAHVDNQFFSALAQARGTPADRQFFQTMNFTSPPGAWAIYLEGVSDLGACTRYGTGTLVETYRRWTQFQRAFPDGYARPSANAMEAVAEELIRPVCACGDLASVTRELESFVAAFPSAPLSRQVTATLRALKENPATVRTRCRPM